MKGRSLQRSGGTSLGLSFSLRERKGTSLERTCSSRHFFLMGGKVKDRFSLEEASLCLFPSHGFIFVMKGMPWEVKERRGRGRPLPPAIRLSSPSFPFLSGKRKAYRSIRRNGRNMSSLGLPCSHLNKRNESKTKSKRSKLWLSFLERKRNQTISRSCLPFPKGKGKEICLSMGRSRKSPSYVGLFPQTLHHVGLGSFP